MPPRRRGERRNQVDFAVIAANMRSKHELIDVAISSATKQNIARAKRLLMAFTALTGDPDPVSVTEKSSVLVMNLLSSYCKMGKKDALGDDSMGALVQGLRHLYDEHGHDEVWTLDKVSKKAFGNPLRGNPSIESLRRAHRVNLARYGSVKLRAKPVTISQVANHASRFWHGSDGKVDPRDEAIHAIWLLGLNLGLRFDEVSKLRLENVTVDDNNITISLLVSIKNSTVQRDYVFREWPSPALRSSIFADPFVAFLSFLKVRGDVPGFLFCDMSTSRNAGIILNPRKPWSNKCYTAFMRERLSEIGVGAGNLPMYSGHSLKRGCVQLYRSMHVRDEQIMDIIQMSGPNAYYNYTVSYNTCAPPDLPGFDSVDEYISHANQLEKERLVVMDHELFDGFITELEELEI